MIDVPVAAAAAVVARICEDAKRSRVKDVIRLYSNSCRRHHCVSVAVSTLSTTPNRKNAS